MLKRLISTSVLVVLVGAASDANAFTGTADKRTYFTFSQAVALPGVTLPAGTYMFRLADETTTRKVIEVANKEGTHSFAMLNTVPVYRLDPPRDPEVRFMETASGAPVAVRAWWKAGESTGYGFIYSKDQLAALNRSASAEEPKAEARIETPVAEPSVEAEVGEPVAAESVSSEPAAIDGSEAPAEQSEQVAQIQASEQASASSVEDAPSAQDAGQEPARQELPRTASPLALLLLGGVASTSVGLRLVRRS